MSLYTQKMDTAQAVPILLAWIGIMKKPEAPEVFDKVVQDCTASLTTSGDIVDGKIEITMDSISDFKANPYVNEKLLKKVINWAYSGEKPVLQSNDLSSRFTLEARTEAQKHPYWGVLSNSGGMFLCYSDSGFYVSGIWFRSHDGNISYYDLRGSPGLAGGLATGDWYPLGFEVSASVDVATGVLPTPNSSPSTIATTTAKSLEISPEKYWSYNTTWVDGNNQEMAQTLVEVPFTTLKHYKIGTKAIQAITDTVRLKANVSTPLSVPEGINNAIKNMRPATIDLLTRSRGETLTIPYSEANNDGLDFSTDIVLLSVAEQNQEV